MSTVAYLIEGRTSDGEVVLTEDGRTWRVDAVRGDGSMVVTETLEWGDLTERVYVRLVE